MNYFEILFIITSLSLFVLFLLIAVDKICSFVEKKLYKKPFYKYTASDCINKLAISEEEFLLLADELK